MKRRIAVLYDEQGKEVYRGSPAEMPVRFVEEDGSVIETTMMQVSDVGMPIDPNSGNDLSMHQNDV